MTWEELKAKAKEMGWKVISDNQIMLVKGGYFNGAYAYYAFKNGCMVYEYIEDGSHKHTVIFAEHRTPDQMWQIMEALR